MEVNKTWLESLLKHADECAEAQKKFIDDGERWPFMVKVSVLTGYAKSAKYMLQFNTPNTPKNENGEN